MTVRRAIWAGETADTSAAEHLAIDDSLLELRDRATGDPSTSRSEMADEPPLTVDAFRLWTVPMPTVIVGRSGKLAREVRQDVCEALGVAVLRRSTGGGTIVAGPGCLMYSVVLSHAAKPELAQIDVAHRTVLGHVVAAIGSLGLTTAIRGSSDLVLQPDATTGLDNSGHSEGLGRADEGTLRKFSGNAMRLGRRSLLYHGTLLFDFDLDLIARLIPPPPREPAYRQGRDHDRFVTNLPVSQTDLAAAMLRQFVTDDRTVSVPDATVERWLADRYRDPAWHTRH